MHATVMPHLACAGTEATMPLTDLFRGDRYGQVRDPFGLERSIAMHQRDVSPREMQEAMKMM